MRSNTKEGNGYEMSDGCGYACVCVCVCVCEYMSAWEMGYAEI